MLSHTDVIETITNLRDAKFTELETNMRDMVAGQAAMNVNSTTLSASGTTTQGDLNVKFATIMAW